ncbi:MAG: transcriptional repressor, partial [Victivallaceae bacterium]
NLEQLSQLGWIRCINGRQKRFDGVLNPHYHMHCNCCGRVINVEIEDTLTELNHASEAVVKLLGYDSVDLMFHGVCANCSRAKGK